MATTQKLQAGVTVVWGTSGVSTQSYGKLRSCSHKRSAERELLPDEEGNTCGVVYYDEKDELTLEVMCSSSAAMPTIGDTVTVNSIQGYVENAELKWDHKGVKMISITATRFKNNALPA